MYDVGDSLREGLASAGGRIRAAQQAVVRANSGELGRGADSAMAATAEAAIFTEALLAAEHARLAEIKAAAK